jgi:hypothetical protein
VELLRAEGVYIEELKSMKKQWLFVGVSVVLTAVLLGCGVAPQAPKAIPPTTTDAPNSPLSSPTGGTQGAPNAPLPPSANTGPVILYERSGGLRGENDMWRIYGDGRVEGTRKGQAVTHAPVTLDVVNTAVTRLANAGFFQLEDAYMPANKCCDRYTYKITLVQGGQSKTVTTMDGVNYPPALAQALQTVDELTR